MANDKPAPKNLDATGWVRAMEPAAGEAGGSEPHLFSTSDGPYMVKATNNPQIAGSSRMLVNELVAGICMDWLGIKHPSPAVVNVPQSVIDDSPGSKFNNGTRFGSGKAFGSSYCQSDPPGAVGVEQLDKANVAGTMLHDTWLRQGDGRQYRVRKSAENQKVYDFIPVDHGNYIGNSWTSAQLNADRDVPVPAPVAPVTPTDVKPFTDRLRQFKQEDAEHIVSQIPAEWLDEADRKALAAYLTDRAKLAADAVAAKYPTEEKK